MVNFVIDNLLSSTKNRAIYETLWSLVIHKKKIQQQKFNEVCLAQICNDLLEDLKNDEQYDFEQKNKFYLTTQLAFGAVQVYKFQIHKLFNQVKHALATCTSKAFEFDWLNSSQTTPEVKKSVKKRKIIEKDFLLECESLECLAEDVFKVQKRSKKIQKIQSIDPTTVQFSRTITLLDPFHSTQSTADCNDDDDFGVMTAEEFETLLDPDISQESSLRTFCINSRSKKRKYTEVFETDQTQDINQTTILDQIGNISRQYSEVYNDDIPRSSSQTKHSKSCDTLQDFSHIEDQTLHDVSLFNCSANELNTIDDQTFIYNEETNPTVLENTEHFDLNATPPSLSVKEMMLPKLNQLQLKRKQKQRKFRFVDKLLKMPITKNMSISFDQYQKLHMEDLPRVNFDQMVYKHKFGVDVLFQTASRPNISPRLLMQFKRHLKKIPQTVIDKKSPRNNVAQESTPISKKPTTKMNPAVVKCSGEKNNNTILGMELPDVDSEMLKSARMSLWMNDEIDIAEPVAMMKPKTRNTVVHEYDENKRWSQDMIMERLEELWNDDEQEINMLTLCGRLNRFVCAGIFFELMNLSKIGMITLESKNGHPEIYHIQRNEP